MFRPWVWAIIRLSLDLSSNHTISRVYKVVGVVGGRDLVFVKWVA